MVTSAPTPPHSATVYLNHRGPQGPGGGGVGGPGGATQFRFPDPPLKLQEQVMSPAVAGAPPKVTSPNPIIDSVKSYDSDKTLSGELSTVVQVFFCCSSSSSNQARSPFTIPKSIKSPD